MQANDEAIRKNPNASLAPSDGQVETPEAADQKQMRRAVHDLKNWLAGIRLTCDGALMEPVPAMDFREALEHIQVAADEAGRLCEDMLTEEPDSAMNRSDGDPAPNGMFQKVQTLVEGILPEHVTLDWDVDSDLPAPAGDIRELERVLTNLIKNSIEAFDEEAGVITVKTQVIQSDDLKPASASELPPDFAGHDLMIEVEDSGCGMDAKTQCHVFEPSFTTKADGHGLGLDSVREIVEAQNGRIEIQSRPGRGTLVRIWFPCEISACDDESTGQSPPPNDDGQPIPS